MGLVLRPCLWWSDNGQISKTGEDTKVLISQEPGVFLSVSWGVCAQNTSQMFS